MTRREAEIEYWRATADNCRAVAAAWGHEPHIQAATVRRAEAADRIADAIAEDPTG